MAHETRDTIIDYVRQIVRILGWMNVPEGTFHKWKNRYGKVNEHMAGFRANKPMAGWWRKSSRE